MPRISVKMSGRWRCEKQRQEDFRSLPALLLRLIGELYAHERPYYRRRWCFKDGMRLSSGFPMDIHTQTHMLAHKEIQPGSGKTGDSSVKSTSCSSTESEFHFQPTSCNSSSRESSTFWSLPAPTYICADTHTHNKIIKQLRR